MVYTFDKALEEKILTVEDILTKARMDAEYGFCQKEYYLDGGSTGFLYEDYTILKYSTFFLPCILKKRCATSIVAQLKKCHQKTSKNGWHSSDV